MPSEEFQRRVEEADASSSIFGSAVTEREEDDNIELPEKTRRFRYGDVAISLDSREIYLRDVEGEVEPISFGYSSGYPKSDAKIREALKDLARGEELHDVKKRHYTDGNTSTVRRVEDYLKEDQDVVEERFREGFQKVAGILDEGYEFVKEEIKMDAPGFRERGYSRDEFTDLMSRRYGLAESTIRGYISETDAWDTD